MTRMLPSHGVSASITTSANNRIKGGDRKAPRATVPPCASQMPQTTKYCRHTCPAMASTQARSRKAADGICAGLRGNL